LTLLDLCFYTPGNLIDSAPLVLIFGSASYYTEALQNVYDVVDSSSLNTKLLGAAVQQQNAFSFNSIREQKSFAQLTQWFFFAWILGLAVSLQTDLVATVILIGVRVAIVQHSIGLGQVEGRGRFDIKVPIQII
jgi:hypothetical protein